MGNSVSWTLAERVAGWVASGNPRTQQGSPASLRSVAESLRLEADLSEATVLAAALVEEATGLRPLTGPARSEVLDRPGWVKSNLRTFERLTAPVLDRVASRSRFMQGPLGDVAGAATGVELGVVLGWMSKRVLGQYDLLLAEDDADGDVVRYVGPNILAIEQRYGFPERQFRLWIALHELTHRAQFTAVDWLGPYFLGLVEEGLVALSPDGRQMLAALRRALDDARRGGNPVGEMGLMGMLVPPEQRELLGRIQALMSLLEGHGDVTMDRAGKDAVPEAAWFAECLRERRKSGGAPARLIQQLLGIDAKMRQYEQGENFVRAVEASGGSELLGVVWKGAEWLPTMEEIRDPGLWISRAGSEVARSSR
ncbi:MAG: zinc-dependent metalloprotease [Acidimicrobiales bacterium]